MCHPRARADHHLASRRRGQQGRCHGGDLDRKVKTCVQIGGIIVIYLHYIIFGALASQPNTSFSAIFAIRTDGADLILTIVGWVVTLVTIYSGYDYLKKNWDLIKDGAVKAK